MKYLEDLPTASVIIPFSDEHLSTLMRTVHSVINHSPAKLLKEVILVNDYSLRTVLYDDLRAYIATNFKKVRLIELKERSGLIVARMVGARAARGDVLIFLDAHCETNPNWLPPLLELIALNYRVCTCPFIDLINWATFKYSSQDEGMRGVFNWRFLYKRLPIRPGDQNTPTDAFPSPVMAGGLFAISAKFFWELGGYDEGLDIWGGEQYELSFKIWQCGGAMFDVPCSRVGHIYRNKRIAPNPRPGKEYLAINYRRVAEVWMDEYAEALYERRPETRNVDPGDVSKQKAMRERLQCKPFKWFLEEIAPDLLEKYPVKDPDPFARGAIQSVAAPNYCIDTLNQRSKAPPGLYPCLEDPLKPSATQDWILSVERDLRNEAFECCIDLTDMGHDRADVTLYGCHGKQGHQLFRYNLETHQLLAGHEEHFCLEADIKSRVVKGAVCNPAKLEQKWKWGFTNETALKSWRTYGKKLLK